MKHTILVCDINMGLCSEVRKLKIPPHMGYGDKGVAGAIPGMYVQVFTLCVTSWINKSGYR